MRRGGYTSRHWRSSRQPGVQIEAELIAAIDRASTSLRGHSPHPVTGEV